MWHCTKQGLVMTNCQILAKRDRNSKKIGDRDETETYIDKTFFKYHSFKIMIDIHSLSLVQSANSTFD